MTASGTPAEAVTPKVVLPRIQVATHKNGVCHDDSRKPVKAQTIDELHSFQKKRTAPTTPVDGVVSDGSALFAPMSEEEHHRLQLQSISASLASLTRGTGPKLVKGDPTKKTTNASKPVIHSRHHHPHVTPTIGVSDSALKFTHVLYNLSPAEQACD